MFDIIFDLILECIKFAPAFIVLLCVMGFMNGAFRR